MNLPTRWLRPLALAGLWPASGSAAAGLPPDALIEQKEDFGLESSEPVVIRRDVHRGAVRLGPLHILEEDVRLAADSAKRK